MMSPCYRCRTRTAECHTLCEHFRRYHILNIIRSRTDQHLKDCAGLDEDAAEETTISPDDPDFFSIRGTLDFRR